MFIIQMTGLSGVGKSTLASALKEDLSALGLVVEVIDADVYRNTMNQDLGFSAADRKENIRRLANVAYSWQKKGVVSIIAAINPYEEIRAELRERFGAITIWVRSDLNTLIQRDTKGLYKKALLPDNHPEKIWNLTGINDVYEIPKKFELLIDTGKFEFQKSRKKLLTYICTLVDI